MGNMNFWCVNKEWKLSFAEGTFEIDYGKGADDGATWALSYSLFLKLSLTTMFVTCFLSFCLVVKKISMTVIDIEWSELN